LLSPCPFLRVPVCGPGHLAQSWECSHWQLQAGSQDLVKDRERQRQAFAGSLSLRLTIPNYDMNVWKILLSQTKQTTDPRSGRLTENRSLCLTVIYWQNSTASR
jgi:hypothetical protein